MLQERRDLRWEPVMSGLRSVPQRANLYLAISPHYTCHTQLITKQVILLPSQYDTPSVTLRAKEIRNLLKPKRIAQPIETLPIEA